MRYIGLVFQRKKSGKLQTQKIGLVAQKLILAPALVGSILGGFFFVYQAYIILLSIMLDGIQRGWTP